MQNKYSYNFIKIYYKNKAKNVRQYSTYFIEINTKLGVWGSNINSTVGLGRFTKIVKNRIKLPPYQKSVVIGILLSDGKLFSSKPHENPRLELKQSIKNSNYLLFVFSILSHYCNVLPYFVKNNRNDKIHLAVVL